ncbi:MAG: hypothetical protein JXR48_17090 [Candidatus Delongbacteria bacterium]|nr:hypothetical protein [Candidatus Delongbacteria bacterium]MBN2836674.1 hypothetical protein [Candidatus Delongbacteria bacterium]
MNKFKFHFKNNLPHQEGALQSTLAILKGMEKRESNFTIVSRRKPKKIDNVINEELFEDEQSLGVSNYLKIDNEELAHNINSIQTQNGIKHDPKNNINFIVPKDFTIEMETGTGKTYVYIKTALEKWQRIMI